MEGERYHSLVVRHVPKRRDLNSSLSYNGCGGQTYASAAFKVQTTCFALS